MAVFELYSKRRKRERGETRDVYVYDQVPMELRKQIIHIWFEVIGGPEVANSHYREAIRDIYYTIVQILRREYGTFTLYPKTTSTEPYASRGDLTTWFLNEEDIERVLDAVELSFSVMIRRCSSGYCGRKNARSMVEAAVHELNVRFREHGVGYELQDDKIIRIDSQLIHAEAVIPALTMLRRPGFENANDEFIAAFEHFRHGNKSEALVECCKCFESTMKVICDKHGWTYDARATVSDLVRVLYEKEVVPPYWQTHLSGLRSVLESAIATPRNRQAGHGAGSGPAQDPPQELVAYVLHMTAATVLFLTESAEQISA